MGKLRFVPCRFPQALLKSSSKEKEADPMEDEDDTEESSDEEYNPGYSSSDEEEEEEEEEMEAEEEVEVTEQIGGEPEEEDISEGLHRVSMCLLLYGPLSCRNSSIVTTYVL